MALGRIIQTDILKRTEKAEDDMIFEPLLTTNGLVEILGAMMKAQQVHGPVKAQCQTWWEACCTRSVEAYQMVNDGSTYTRDLNSTVRIQINAISGSVDGWDMFVTRCSRKIVNDWWLYQTGIGAHSGSVHITTAVKFAIQITNGKNYKAVDKSTFNRFLGVANDFVKAYLDVWVKQLYGSRQTLQTLPPVLRTSGRSPWGEGARSGLIGRGLCASAAWETLEKARVVCRASARQVCMIRSDQAEMLNVSPDTGSKWVVKATHTYMEMMLESLQGKIKFQLVADPGVHFGHNLMQSYVWDIENLELWVGVNQVIVPGKRVQLNEFEFPEGLDQQIFNRQAQRTKSFREMQALNALMFRSTGRALSDCKIPDSCSLEPVLHNEVRVVVPDGFRLISYIIDRYTRAKRRVLPDDEDPAKWLSAVLSLDSGPTIRAGANYLIQKEKLNTFLHPDRIHRLIRDIKLAAEHSINKNIYRVTLWWVFVSSMNGKPFNSGEWYHLKKEMLEEFMQTHTWNSPKFIKYAKLWAASIGEPEPESEDAFELWWNKLTELPSYIRKLEPVKPMRWFSVNQCIYETRCEFWPSKMIYKSYSPENGHEGAEDELDPALQISGDPKAELRQLRSTESGFPLAARLMCQWTMSRANIYYHGIIFVFVLFFFRTALRSQ